MESVERLWNDGPFLIQSDDLIKAGADAMLLAAFPRVKKGTRICELGAGTGAISIILAARHEDIVIDALELDERAAELFARGVRLNGFEGSINVIRGDLRNAGELLKPSSYDLVICNPPYFPLNSGKLSKTVSLSKSEEGCTLKDVCTAARTLLRGKGSLALSYRPERLADMFEELRRADMEPKTLRFAGHNRSAQPFLALIEGRKGAKAGLKLLPTLLLCEEDGSMTNETKDTLFNHRVPKKNVAVD